MHTHMKREKKNIASVISKFVGSASYVCVLSEHTASYFFLVLSTSCSPSFQMWMCVTKFVTIKQANQVDVQCCEMITWKLFHTNRCWDFSTIFPTPTRTNTSVPTYLIPSLVLLFCSIWLRHFTTITSISLCCRSNRTYHITHIILEIVLHFRVSLYLYEHASASASVSVRLRISCLNDHV